MTELQNNTVRWFLTFHESFKLWPKQI